MVLFFTILLWCLSAVGQDDDFGPLPPETKINLILALREFAENYEAKNAQAPGDFSVFLSRLINAYADDEAECVIGGWISTRNEVKRCGLPEENELYQQQKRSCSEGQLLCNPVLFGDKLCVGFSSSEQKNNAFKNCDAAFDKQNRNLSQIIDRIPDHEFKDYMKRVRGVCSKEKSKTCSQILQKFNEYVPGDHSGNLSRAQRALDQDDEKAGEKIQPKLKTEYENDLATFDKLKCDKINTKDPSQYDRYVQCSRLHDKLERTESLLKRIDGMLESAAEECDAVPKDNPVAQLASSATAAARESSCSAAEKQMVKNKCAQDSLCLIESNVIGGGLIKLFRGGKSACTADNPAKQNNCMANIMSSIMNVLTGALKSLGELVTLAWEVSGAQRLWANLWGLEDKSTAAQSEFKKMSRQVYQQFKDQGAKVFISNVAKSIMDAAMEYMKTDILCQKWEGNSPGGKCLEPYKGYECMRCGKSIVAACRALGGLIATGGAMWTGGAALGFLSKAAQAGGAGMRAVLATFRASKAAAGIRKKVGTGVAVVKRATLPVTKAVAKPLSGATRIAADSSKKILASLKKNPLVSKVKGAMDRFEKLPEMEVPPTVLARTRLTASNAISNVASSRPVTAIRQGASAVANSTPARIIKGAAQLPQRIAKSGQSFAEKASEKLGDTVKDLVVSRRNIPNAPNGQLTQGLAAVADDLSPELPSPTPSSAPIKGAASEINSPSAHVDLETKPAPVKGAAVNNSSPSPVKAESSPLVVKAPNYDNPITPVKGAGTPASELTPKVGGVEPSAPVKGAASPPGSLTIRTPDYSNPITPVKGASLPDSPNAPKVVGVDPAQPVKGAANSQASPTFPSPKEGPYNVPVKGATSPNSNSANVPTSELDPREPQVSPARPVAQAPSLTTTQVDSPSFPVKGAVSEPQTPTFRVSEGNSPVKGASGQAASVQTQGADWDKIARDLEAKNQAPAPSPSLTVTKADAPRLNESPKLVRQERLPNDTTPAPTSVNRAPAAGKPDPRPEISHRDRFKEAGIDEEKLVASVKPAGVDEVNFRREVEITRSELNDRFDGWKKEGVYDEIMDHLKLVPEANKKRDLALLLNVRPKSELPELLRRLRKLNEAPDARKPGYISSLDRRIAAIDGKKAAKNLDEQSELALSAERSSLLLERELVEKEGLFEIKSIVSTKATNKNFTDIGKQGHSLDDSFTLDIEVKKNFSVCRGSFAGAGAVSHLVGGFTTTCRDNGYRDRDVIGDVLAAPGDAKRTGKATAGYERMNRFEVQEGDKLSLGLNGKVTYTDGAQAGTGGFGGGIEYFTHRTGKTIPLDRLQASVRIPTCRGKNCDEIFAIQEEIRVNRLSTVNNPQALLERKLTEVDSMLKNSDSRLIEYQNRVRTQGGDPDMTIFREEYPDLSSLTHLRREIELKMKLPQGKLDADTQRLVRLNAEADQTKVDFSGVKSTDVDEVKRRARKAIEESSINKTRLANDARIADLQKKLIDPTLDPARRQQIISELGIHSGISEDINLALSKLNYRVEKSIGEAFPDLNKRNALVESVASDVRGAPRPSITVKPTSTLSPPEQQRIANDFTQRFNQDGNNVFWRRELAQARQAEELPTLNRLDERVTHLMEQKLKGERDLPGKPWKTEGAIKTEAANAAKAMSPEDKMKWIEKNTNNRALDGPIVSSARKQLDEINTRYGEGEKALLRVEAQRNATRQPAQITNRSRDDIMTEFAVKTERESDFLAHREVNGGHVRTRGTENRGGIQDNQRQLIANEANVPSQHADFITVRPKYSAIETEREFSKLFGPGENPHLKDAHSVLAFDPIYAANKLPGQLKDAEKLYDRLLLTKADELSPRGREMREYLVKRLEDYVCYKDTARCPNARSFNSHSVTTQVEYSNIKTRARELLNKTDDKLTGQEFQDRFGEAAGKLTPDQRRLIARDLRQEMIDRGNKLPPLNDNQLAAIDRAHNVGKGKNYITYSDAEIQEKALILKNAGFTKEEVRALVRGGITGNSTPDTRPGLSKLTPDETRALVSSRTGQAQKLADQIDDLPKPSLKDPNHATKLEAFQNKRNDLINRSNQALEEAGDAKLALARQEANRKLEMEALGDYVKAGSAKADEMFDRLLPKPGAAPAIKQNLERSLLEVRNNLTVSPNNLAFKQQEAKLVEAIARVDAGPSATPKPQVKVEGKIAENSAPSNTDRSVASNGNEEVQSLPQTPVEKAQEAAEKMKPAEALARAEKILEGKQPGSLEEAWVYYRKGIDRLEFNDPKFAKGFVTSMKRDPSFARKLLDESIASAKNGDDRINAFNNLVDNIHGRGLYRSQTGVDPVHMRDLLEDIQKEKIHLFPEVQEKLTNMLRTMDDRPGPRTSEIKPPTLRSPAQSVEKLQEAANTVKPGDVISQANDIRNGPTKLNPNRPPANPEKASYLYQRAIKKYSMEDRAFSDAFENGLHGQGHVADEVFKKMLEDKKNLEKNLNETIEYIHQNNMHRTYVRGDVLTPEQKVRQVKLDVQKRNLNRLLSQLSEQEKSILYTPQSNMLREILNTTSEFTK